MLQIVTQPFLPKYKISLKERNERFEICCQIERKRKSLCDLRRHIGNITLYHVSSPTIPYHCDLIKANSFINRLTFD